MTHPTPPRPEPQRFFSWLRERVRQMPAVRKTIRYLLLLVLAGVLGVYALCTLGFPPGITHWVEDRVGETGFDVRLGRLCLDMEYGLVAEDARFFSSVAAREPLVEVEWVSFQVDPAEWLRGNAGLKGVLLQGATLPLPGASPDPPAGTAPALGIDRIELRFEPGGIRVSSLELALARLPVTGRGFIRTGRDETQPAAGGLPRREDLYAWMRPYTTVVRNVSGFLQQVDYGAPPSVECRFFADAVDPGRSRFDLTGEGGEVRVRGVSFTNWHVDLQWRDDTLELESLSARAADGRLEAEGRLDLDRNQAESRIQCALPAVYWTSLMPTNWARRLQRANVFAQGPIRGEMTLGPAPLPGLLNDMSGWVELSRASLNGVWMESAFSEFAWTAPELRLDGMEAVIGRAGERGRFRGRFAMDTDTRAYDGQWYSTFHPIALEPVLGPDQLEQAHAVQLRDHPLLMKATFSGLRGQPELFTCDGVIAATNALYRGGYADTMQTGFRIETNWLYLDPLLIRQGTNECRGRLAIGFRDGVADFDLNSTLDLTTVAKMVGRDMERSISAFRVEGHTALDARGRVGLGDRRKTDFVADVEAADFGYRWFLADRCAFQYRWRGDEVQVADIRGELYGGQFRAGAELDIRRGFSNAQYRVTANWTNVNFADVVVNLRQTRRDPYQGYFSGNLDLSGVWGSTNLHGLEGRGGVHIREGKLFKIPLLGGLSKYLSMVVPGFGFSTQTELDAPFEIDGPKAVSRDINLYGDIVSIQGKGVYFFDRQLDFTVEAKLLREGLIAEAFRLLTLPVSKLLQFRLTGTLEEPRWRPANWPTEWLREGPDL